MYHQIASYPVGQALTDRLDDGHNYRLHCTYQQGEIVNRYMTDKTESCTILRCFIDLSTGAGNWYLETWTHDNGYRSSVESLSVRQASDLLRPV